MLRRVLVLLTAVIVAAMMSVGPALAHGGKRHTVCHVFERGPDATLRGLTHKQANWHINNHPNDYRGACR